MHLRRPALFSVRRLTLLAAIFLYACSTPRPSSPEYDLQPLLPADAVLLGEQHDAPEHQAIHTRTVQRLAERGQLAALALEMAEQGHSTQALPAQADAAAVRAALQWDDAAWPWSAYGPAVMAAVRAGVPVYGANLPRARMRQAMQDATLDARLPNDALRAQQDAIATGHCGLLPPSQIAPMARIQIARDLAMAGTLQAHARPGQTVLLLAGSAHVDRELGVPRHLPPAWRGRSVRLRAGGPTDGAPAEPGFDAIWTTPPVASKDHCADLRRQLQR